MASAVWRIKSSLTLQPNLFQLFHPIGGVRANPASCPNNAGAAFKKMKAKRVNVLVLTSFISHCTDFPVRI
jgi:hypothetical protein